jgi:GrpB-like predicted nucleotidyltransferase (UPF0157 family)
LDRFCDDGAGGTLTLAVPIKIHPYSAEWPTRYEDCAKRIRGALGPKGLRVEHIGSTAVPGLAAKDIIDIQVSVASFLPEAAYRPPLESLGYTYRPDDEPAHRFFKRDGPGGRRLVNIHVCEVGSAWEERHLLFREFLRTNPKAAAVYELLKVRLSGEHDDVLSYTVAKSDFIAKAMASRPK